MEVNEQKAIQECHKGHFESFAVVYDLYVKKIYNFVYFRTHHKETAEDVTSQIFIKALKNVQSYSEAQGSFSSWLYAIARNTLIDHYRTQRNSVDVDDIWDLKDSTNIEKDTDTKFALEKIQKYLLLLPHSQREIIIMRLWDQLSYKEIADITKKSEASLKMNFSRSVAKLRDEIKIISLLLLFLSSRI